MSYIGNQPTTVAFLTDQFSGTGSQTAFTLSAAPANTNSIIVAVSGVLQDPSTYSVSGTALTFSAAPPAGTGNISVRFLGIPASGVTTTAYRTVTEFTATAGQTTFTPPSYTVGYINVYRNGALLGTADYTATNGTTVVLASAASSGDLVVVESFYVSSVVGAMPQTAGIVTQAYIGNGVSTTGPAFGAYATSSQTISDSTFTKVTLNAELFDTASCFDTSLSRFTPNVAGYYQLGAFAYTGAYATTNMFLDFRKNGARCGLTACSATSAGQYAYFSGGALVYANGTTDYFELNFYQDSGSSRTLSSGSDNMGFNGFLARAA